MSKIPAGVNTLRLSPWKEGKGIRLGKETGDISIRWRALILYGCRIGFFWGCVLMGRRVFFGRGIMLMRKGFVF